MVLLLVIGFLAGVVTAISPCVLPVLPILLAGGASGGRRRPYAIIAGLVLSFTVFTLTAAWIVDRLGLPDDFLRNAALVLLFVVAATLLVPRLGELLERPFLPLTRRRPAGSGGGFVLGLSLGLVFVPCAGPIFSYVVVRAGSEHLNSKAVLLIVAYSLGAAVPMLLVALGGREISSKLRGPRGRPALGVVMALDGGGARRLRSRARLRPRLGLAEHVRRPAALARVATREGRAGRLLDVLLHQLPAHAPAPGGVGPRLPQGRPRDRRRPHARVRLRALAVECALGNAASRRPLPRRARQRLRHVGRLLEPVLARRVPPRPARPRPPLPLRRGRVRPHGAADPAAAGAGTSPPPLRHRDRRPHADGADDAGVVPRLRTARPLRRLRDRPRPLRDLPL